MEILLDIAWPRDSQFKLDRLVYPDVTFRFNFKYFTDTDCEKKDYGTMRTDDFEDTTLRTRL